MDDKGSEYSILEQAFADATQLDGEALESYLVDFGARQPALVEQLVDLLKADGNSELTLAAPIAAAISGAMADAEDLWIGRTVDHWTLTKRIAEGGMGTVYLAERADEQFDQTAALKLMSAQLRSSDAVARFLAERQILANLNHPGIASLIDGGTTEERVPYLVMEFIDGEPIDSYCDRRQLSIDERLELFVEFRFIIGSFVVVFVRFRLVHGSNYYRPFGRLSISYYTYERCP